MNNHNLSSARLVHSSLAAVAALPASTPAAPSAHTTLRVLFADPAFVRTLRDLVRYKVKACDVSELLDNARQRGLSAPSSPEELDACRSWVQALVQRQVDNYRWHGGLPLAPSRYTAQPRDTTAAAVRDQLLAEDDPTRVV